MPTFISHKGVWHPAKEHIGLVYKGNKEIPRESLPEGVMINGDVLKPNEPFIYNGPDREALKILNKDNNGNPVGRDFRTDPEFLQSVRNQGFNNVTSYLKAIGFDESEVDKEFERKAAVVQAHEVPKRVEAIEIMGGGRDFSGSGKDISGGFGEVSADEIKSKR